MPPQLEGGELVAHPFFGPLAQGDDLTRHLNVRCSVELDGLVD